VSVTQRHRLRALYVALALVVTAVALAGYGIWSREATLTHLQQLTDDSAIPRVQIIVPKPGPAERTLTLPGNVAAWNEAPIYAQVSGYVTKWYKDYGAQVKKGDLLAEIQARGIANSLGARRSGLNALSVPVFDRDGRVVVAVTALGMAPRFDADMAGPLARRMLSLSAELSAQMGWAAIERPAPKGKKLRNRA